MIWYVDIEHEEALGDPSRVADFIRVRNERAQVCSKAAGMPCAPIHYRQVSWELARKHGLQAIAISGNCTDWAEYDWPTFDPLFERAGALRKVSHHRLLRWLPAHRPDGRRPLRPHPPPRPGRGRPRRFRPRLVQRSRLPARPRAKRRPTFQQPGKRPGVLRKPLLGNQRASRRVQAACQHPRCARAGNPLPAPSDLWHTVPPRGQHACIPGWLPVIGEFFSPRRSQRSPEGIHSIAVQYHINWSK